MKKIITKHFYKMLLLIITFFYIVSIFSNSKHLNVIFLISTSIILYLLYFIRKEALNEIARKFLTQQHYIEDKEDKYMSEEELNALYNKLYDEYFNC